MNDSTPDTLSVANVVYRYAQYLDTKNWTEMPSIFESEIDMDFQDLTGNPPGRAASSDFVSFASGALDGIKTQHIIANPKITTSQGRLTCIADHQSMHYREIDGAKTLFTLHGTYEFGMNGSGATWKISGVRQTISFNVGDPRVMQTN